MKKMNKNVVGVKVPMQVKKTKSAKPKSGDRPPKVPHVP